MTSPESFERPRRWILPPVWLLLAIAAAVALDRFVPLVEFGGMVSAVAGGACVATGLAMILVSAGAFARAETGIVPFQPSTELVTSGFYRFTRNPMYLGMALILVGLGVLLGSVGALLPLLPFVLIIDRRFIAGEERMLEATFQERYRAYRANVRRWL